MNYEFSDINYTYGGSNIIGGEFSEYFTPSLLREMKQRDMCEGDNTAFTIEVSALHQETHLAQCLICGGRGNLPVDERKKPSIASIAPID